MSNPTLDEVQKRFPLGDFIEYQTGHGLFCGIIKGYVVESYGVSIDLGDRRCPLWSNEDFQRAATWHRTATSISERGCDRNITPVSRPIQLTLF